MLMDTGRAELVNIGAVRAEHGILRRPEGWPENRISTVTRGWEGETFVCIGGGPSLTIEQVAMVRAAGKRTIAINDAYLLAPWADICYFADSEWHGWHTAGVARPALGLSAEQVRKRFAEFAGEKCSLKSTGMNVTDPQVHLLRVLKVGGLSRDAQAIRDGRHGGYHALNLGVLAGGTRAILIGYDGEQKNGKRHWHGDHQKIEPTAVFQVYRESFRTADAELKKLGVHVINASPGSAIGAFEKMDLAAALAL